MITEIPDADEFEQQGIAFLNLAWETVFHLVLELEDASHWHNVAEAEVSEKYWGAAKDALTTSIALAHQGTEFLLKANIAEVSPYLLLSIRDWSGKWAENDTPYSQLYTVDAQHLVNLHNTVAKERLSPEFKEHFDGLRSMRNRISHTIDRRLKVTVGNVAYYTILHLKSGRRSYSTGHTDVMGSATQISQNSMVLSFEEEVGYDAELDEAVRLEDMLTGSHDDPSTAGARNLDWEEFISTHDCRYLCIIHDLASGRTMIDTARACRMTYNDVREIREKLLEDLEAFMGSDAIADAARVPGWRGNILADHEKMACRAERRRG